MADKRDSVNWSDKAAIWARVPSAKSAVTRACTTIDKLTDREFNYATPAACDDARKRLTKALDFCVKLHDRWSDLETEDGSETASETADKSLRPYEENQFAALAKLDKYIAKNSKATPSSYHVRRIFAVSILTSDDFPISKNHPHHLPVFFTH